MTAASIMDKAASLLNDTARTIYTYTAQIPYVNMALDELEEYYQLDNMPITNDVSAVLAVPAGALGIGGGAPQPALPTGLIEPRQLWEAVGSTYVPMTPVDFIPIGGVQTNQLIYWTWQEEVIKFIGATVAVNVKIEFIKTIFAPVTTDSSVITALLGKTYLYYRTAGLCAEFIGENPTRAADLNTMAQLSLERSLGISAKGRQAIATRRQPFMAAYKTRSGGG